MISDLEKLQGVASLIENAFKAFGKEVTTDIHLSDKWVWELKVSDKEKEIIVNFSYLALNSPELEKLGWLDNLTLSTTQSVIVQWMTKFCPEYQQLSIKWKKEWDERNKK
jgi:hypothetical protein